MLTKTGSIYDITKSWSENLADGPLFDGEIPPRMSSVPIQFLGHAISSPLGVPAGPLLDSKWIKLAAHLGFDVVSYKTIRSKKYSGHALPNVIFVEGRDGIAYEAERGAQISITNSFGMPSMDEAFLRNDIGKARASLGENQVLIVSVVGTPGNGPSVCDDFVFCARLAKESGAHIVEANFSCPNICSKEGALYTDPEHAGIIARAIVKAVHPLPVLIKVGCYQETGLMRQVFHELARAGVQGICGINSVSMNVINSSGNPALGVGRESSGICGEMIRDKAMEFVRQAKRVIVKERLDLELAGCGGLMLPEHFDEMLGLGAAVVMSATGMMWNPYLAYDWKKRRWE